MVFESIKVRDAVLHELGSDQLAAVVPLLSIRCENTVAKKVLPIVVERFAFAIVVELRRQDRFDVLDIGRKDESLSGDEEINRP